ncbi:peptidase P60 [Bifidobacterium aemilianum]|uniref:Peptidase P60 n=1 Tax=Bifidobacterium aemilianum TaxID=2493120 RepID=A0A366K6M3_9BIFI|nr:C40 family peptidase [Bifidobacterium aemilianum]RBP97395.1 peptidase P60 [Bifidobacterium aemilianum]
MNTLQKSLSTIVAGALVCTAFAVVEPAAFAVEGADDVVTSSRSFRKTTVVRKDLLKESTSSEVEADSNWGGIEQLDVPQTQSQADRDKAAQEAREAAAAAAAAESPEAASRSTARQSQAPQNFTVTPPNGQSVNSLMAFATQFVGKVPYQAGGTTPAGWDCSGFVQYVFANMGVSLPRTSGAQATVGLPVASLAEAQPGDIIANAEHAAIYVGNGMMINSQYAGTKYDAVSVIFRGGYSIRRVL